MSRREDHRNDVGPYYVVDCDTCQRRIMEPLSWIHVPHTSRCPGSIVSHLIIPTEFLSKASNESSPVDVQRFVSSFLLSESDIQLTEVLGTNPLSELLFPEADVHPCGNCNRWIDRLHVLDHVFQCTKDRTAGSTISSDYPDMNTQYIADPCLNPIIFRTEYDFILYLFSFFPLVLPILPISQTLLVNILFLK